VIALACHSYGWAPDVALAQTPRALTFYAEQAERFRLLAQRDLVLAVHTSKPQELLRDLMNATESGEQPKETPLQAMLRLARLTNDQKAAHKIERAIVAERIMARLRGREANA